MIKPKLAKVHELFKRTSSLTSCMKNFDQADGGWSLVASDIIKDAGINQNLQRFSQQILQAKLESEREMRKQLDTRIMQERNSAAFNRAFGNDLLNRICNLIQARLIREEAQATLLQSI